MKISFPNSHLFYIIESRIAGDKYSGLSHVAEHALLIPTDIGKAFRAKAYGAFICNMKALDCNGISKKK